MTGDLPITLAARMMKPWQQHPLSRESPSSPENAGDDRAFATCVSASKTFLRCSLLGRQRIRFLLTTLIWSGRIFARASSTPPSISTILSSSDRRMKCGSSSMPSCHHRWMDQRLVPGTFRGQGRASGGAGIGFGFLRRVENGHDCYTNLGRQQMPFRDQDFDVRGR